MTENYALSARNICKSYGRNTVLNEISFDIEKGLLTGIEGENGSGKSTLLNILAQFRKPDSGKLQMNGTVGFCPQNPLLFFNLTVEENIDFFRQAYGIRRKNAGAEVKNRLEEVLRVFNFPEPLSKKCSKLSGGTVQKLNLIIALLHDPDILLLAATIFVVFITMVIIGVYVALLGSLFMHPLHPGGVILGFILCGYVYGCYGLMIGAILKGELEGILFIVLLANLDVAWLQNPIYYSAAQTKGVIEWLPAFFPSQTTIIYAFTNYSPLMPALAGIAYETVFFIPAFLIFRYRILVKK